jgi:hypothetical protein
VDVIGYHNCHIVVRPNVSYAPKILYTCGFFDYHGPGAVCDGTGFGYVCAGYCRDYPDGSGERDCLPGSRGCWYSNCFHDYVTRNDRDRRCWYNVTLPQWYIFELFRTGNHHPFDGYQFNDVCTRYPDGAFNDRCRTYDNIPGFVPDGNCRYRDCRACDDSDKTALIFFLFSPNGSVTVTFLLTVPEKFLDPFTDNTAYKIKNAYGLGCCWVAQWNVPNPSTIARAFTPVTVRSGKISWRIWIASMSWGSSKTGTITTVFPI